MRIGIVTNDFPVDTDDWRAAFALAFARSLVHAGHKVSVFTPDRLQQKELTEQFPIHWFPWAGGDRPLVKLSFMNPSDIVKSVSLIYKGKREIARFVEQHKAEHLFAFWALPSGLYAYTMNKRFGIPYSVWCLGSDIWIYSRYPIIRGLIRRVLRNARYVFADGLKLCEDVETLSGRHCSFLPTSRTLPSPDRNASPVDPHKKNFLFIGRLERVKGIDVLLEAVADLLADGNMRDIALYVFGVGSYEPFVKEFIARHKLQEYVFFKGFARASDVATYLSSCQWLVIPSRNESIPVVLSDALQMGKPVIVSDAGDMARIVTKYGIGFTAPAGDVAALRDRLQAAVAIPSDQYQALVARTRDALRMFGPAGAVRTFMQHIQG